MSTPADQWSSVAAVWDRNVDDIDTSQQPAVRAYVDAARLQPGDDLLELGAGPGSLAATWSSLVGPDGSVLLTDIAPGMVEAARRRAADLDNVDVAVVDMAAIDRPEASFDVVASRMGLMFVVEPSTALTEMHRVLRGGGRVVAMVWGRIEDNPWMTSVGMAAMSTGLVSGGPPVGPGGMFSLSDPQHLAELVRDAGFGDVETAEIDTVFEAPSVEAHVARVGERAGPLAAAFAAATPEQLAAVCQVSAALTAPYAAADGSLRLPGRAVLVSATKGQ